ncbi:hypothetical protein ID866_1768 [Astraeus odoratus]|nr:hypothetical protein ID866_1768 [Astraeus odoratus]
MGVNYDLQLVYFPVRARGEPILLLLADAGVPFTLKNIPTGTWMDLKRAHQLTSDEFPYSAVPVLHAKDKDGKKDLVLGETSAILSFLEEILAAPGTISEKDVPLEVRNTRDVGQQRAPPQRSITRKGMVARYLKDTEAALAQLQSNIRVVPLPTDRLTGMSAAVVTVIDLITDIFPSLRPMLKEGGKYELCGRLWTTVRGRPGISEYWTKNQVESKPWSITEYGTAEWIAKEAASYDTTQKL